MPEDGRPKEVRHERRVLTALCYDLVGSTDLLAVLDIEDVQDLMSAFLQAARDAVTSCSGVVTVEAGDGGVALFPTEIDVRDAASLAVRAGLQIIEACRRVGREKARADLHVRVGIATSMGLIQEGQKHAVPDNVTGAALAMASRLQAIADPDTVFASNETRSLARRSHVFVFRGVRIIRGFAKPERVWRALRHKREVGRFFAFGRLSAPLVGRVSELRVIAELWGKAVAGTGQALLIEGEPGVGKSRLVHEARRTTRSERAKLLSFQCLPGGDRSTLHPLLQNLSADTAKDAERLTVSSIAKQFGQLGIIDVEVVELFSFLLGADGTNPVLQEADLGTIRDKANWAVRCSLEAMCAKGPILIVVEDVHWIDPTSWQLLAETAQLIHRYPALLIVTARRGPMIHSPQTPDFRRMTLLPLDPEETHRALASMWPESSASALQERLDMLERLTGGIPLFIEEICQWVSETAGAATDRLARTDSPGSISTFESVVEARLGRLGPAKDVVQAAAIAGNRFDQRLLVELLPELDNGTIGDALGALSEAGFVTRIRPSSRPTYGFRHSLIQETIYNALLRKTRQMLQRRLFATVRRDPDIAPWIGTAALAELAERAGLPEAAIELFTTAGKESCARSAMVEARLLLDHALALCEQIGESETRDVLRLSAMAALGPVLTSTEGPNSLPARTLYEDGVEVARRRPIAERARWFPIYWGWWFTGTDVDGERAQTVLNDLREVEDDEVQLQARHCVWAIDFYLGRHESCIAAVDAGLALYRSGREREGVTLYGGHDARVCGLAHRGLSQWFAGRTASAIQSLSDARSWAEQTGHIGSIAHVYLNEAMLNCYRRDFAVLRAAITDIRSLTDEHDLPSLAATAQILEGWCEGASGDVERGIDAMRQGLAIHSELQTPEDYPVYCDMLAEIMARTGDTDKGLELLSSAAKEAERSGHRYWLAALYRRQARLLFQQGARGDDVLSALGNSLAIASEQNAVPLLFAAYGTLVSLGLSRELERHYLHRIELAKSCVEPGAASIVNPEPTPRRRPAK